MIHLIKDYYLDNDKLQFILKKKQVNQKGANVGQEVYVSLGFYPKLEQLLSDAVMKKLKESDYTTLQAMSLAQKELINELSDSIKRIEKELMNNGSINS